MRGGSLATPIFKTFNHMKFTEIKISDSIQLSDGHWRKVSWNAELEQGETPEQATTTARDRLMNWFNETKYDNPLSSLNQREPKQLYTVIEPKTPTQKIIDQINQCTDITVLKTFELLVKKNHELKEAYENQLSKLS